MKIFYKILILTVITGQAALSGKSQEDSSYLYKPFQVTILPPFGSNGLASKDCVNKISLNIFWGVNAGLEGIEFGGIANIERDNVKGAQFAGMANLVKGNVKGLQTSHFVNFVGGDFLGLQTSGFGNFNRGDFRGFQHAGFGNFNGGSMYGISGSGFINMAREVKGMQASGFMNITHKLVGAQSAGFLNIARKVTGAQLSGFMNIARKVKGVQVGFLNIADDYESGVPIGIINIIKHGYHEWEVSGSELWNLHAGYRMGVDKLYTQFMVGANWQEKHDFWGLGFGIGSRFGITRYFKGSADLISYQIMDETMHHRRRPTMLEQVRLTLDGRIFRQVRWFVGPTLNLLIAPNRYPEENITEQITSWMFYTETSGVNSLKIWPGISGGIRF